MNKKELHNRFAHYWATIQIILGTIGLSTIWLDWGDFWKGYVLDMTGPAWNYILFRGLYRSYTETAWTRFFTPQKTFLIFVAVCFSIETAQYLEWYDSTFDPWDFLAYVSILTPLFVLDLIQSKNSKG